MWCFGGAEHSIHFSAGWQKSKIKIYLYYIFHSDSIIREQTKKLSPLELFIILAEHTLTIGIKSVFKKSCWLGWEKETNYSFDTAVFQGVWLKGLTILLRWLKLAPTVFHHSTNSSYYLLSYRTHLVIVLNELVTKSSEPYLNTCCKDFLNIWTKTSCH